MFAGTNNRMLELLWFIGYCREFPSQLAERIGGHPEWNRHVKYEAIKKGYVTVYRTKYRQRVIRSLRLTPLGLEYIAKKDSTVFPFVMAQQDTNSGSRNITERILRYHAQATALIMARNAGAVFLPGEKPSLLANPLASSAPYDPRKIYYYRPGVQSSNSGTWPPYGSERQDGGQVLQAPGRHHLRTILPLPILYRPLQNVLACRN